MAGLFVSGIQASSTDFGKGSQRDLMDAITMVDAKETPFMALVCSFPVFRQLAPILVRVHNAISWTPSLWWTPKRRLSWLWCQRGRHL